MVSFAGQALLLLLTFFSTPYIMHELGATTFGALMLVLTYVEAFGLFDLGINTALVKYIAELLVQKRNQDIQAYFGTALILFFMGGILIAGLITLTSSWVIANLMITGQELRQEIVFALWIASIGFLLRFVSQAVSAIPIAVQRFDIANYVSVSSEIARISGTVIVVYFGYALKGVLVVILVANLISCIVYFAIARRLIPGILLWPKFSSAHGGSLLHFSKYVLIANASSKVVSYADNILIGYFLPVAAVAFYATPYAVCQRLARFGGSLAAVVFPAASSLSATAQSYHLEELYLRGTKMMVAAVSFPALVLFLFSGEFLRYWIGPEFSQQGALAMRLLIIGFFLNCLGQIPFLVLQGTGHPQIAARFIGGQAILNVILFWNLIPHFGISGAAAGFLIAQCIVMPWMTHWANGLLRIRRMQLVIKAYASVVPALILAFLVCVSLRSWIFSLFSLGLVVMVGMVVYLALVVAMVLDAKERATCREFLNGRLSSAYCNEETGKV